MKQVLVIQYGSMLKKGMRGDYQQQNHVFSYLVAGSAGAERPSAARYPGSWWTRYSSNLMKPGKGVPIKA